MKKHQRLYQLLAGTALCAILLSTPTLAGASTDADLSTELAAMDSLLFDRAFNHCADEKLAVFFTADLEFYHDKSGLEFTSRQQFIEQMKIRCAGRFVNGKPKTKRVRDEKSLRVYPLKNYGAIQTGVHYFHELQEDGSYKRVGIAQFTHVWKREESGKWKIARVLSYDHQPAE